MDRERSTRKNTHEEHTHTLKHRHGERVHEHGERDSDEDVVLQFEKEGFNPKIQPLS